MNILLVEDNVLNQLVVGNMLRKNGLQVSIANHGQEALSQITSKGFDMILMDIQMPVMDGYESTSQIRAMNDPYFKNLPIIAFTASMLIDTKEKANQYGMTDYISKPFFYPELEKKINTYVVNKSASRPLCIDFEEHGAEDPTFKCELMKYMKEDVIELQDSLNMTTEQNANRFLETFHKVSTTIMILNDVDLGTELSILRKHFKKTQLLPFSQVQEHISSLRDICTGIVQSLSTEISSVSFS